jgi:hypothetical protein
MRYICVMILLTASGMMAVRNLTPTSRIQIQDESQVLDADIIAWRTQMLDEALRSQARFAETLNAVIGSLAREEISVCQACELVYNRSVEVCPAFLRGLNCVPGGDDRSKIATVLLRHLKVLTEERPEVACVVYQVQQEIQSKTFLAWSRQSWGYAPARGRLHTDLTR